MIKIAPSILSADFVNLERDIKKVATADYLHVDASKCVTLHSPGD